MHRMRRGCLIAEFLIGFALVSRPSEAQYSANFQTNTISSVTSNWSNDYCVGSNTFANALLIRNGGVLTNATGYVGYMQTSSSNRVLVTGTNSVWNCVNDLKLGVSGSGNSLVISNGGRVNGSWCELGKESMSSSNSAVITGPGSTWNAASCYVGTSGSNNQLTVSKGARLYSSSATVGSMSSANNNSVLVSDSGSLWDNSTVASVIIFGADGSGNSLVVSNGGQVLGYYAYVGEMAGSNNSVLVTDPGSGFSVNCYIYTGYLGHSNMFTVANGAAVTDKFCYISYTAVSGQNSVLITGTNSSWQNSDCVFVGFDGTDGSLTISNGGMMGVSQDSALGYDPTSRNNRALVTGAGSVWKSSGNMYVGLNGPLNSLGISHGGQVIDSSGFVGANPGSDSNSLLVVGANSVWTNTGDVYVGDFSVGNSLVVSNGGRVIGSNGFLGRNAGSDSNSVMVAGAGSVWTNMTDMYVGTFGAVNSLVISNGGKVFNDWAHIGYDTNSLNNQALVTGAGSVWSNATAVLVGDSGSGNSLAIRDGGLVGDYWGIVGEGESSSNNSVSVESGGVWSSQQLAVGDAGSHNALFVNGGSVFVTTYMAVGYDSFYCNNLVQLENGQVIVTNTAGNAVLEVHDGSFMLLGGTLRVDTLVVTNDCAQFLRLGGTLFYKTLMLDPNRSAVGDGIPNGWKQHYGLDPFDPNLANKDPDGDGFTRLQKFSAGFNPTNATAYPHIISVARQGANVNVTYRGANGDNTWSPGVASRTNVLEFTTGAAGGGYSNNFVSANVTNILSGGTGAGIVTNMIDSGAATNSSSRYYRVRVLAP